MRTPVVFAVVLSLAALLIMPAWSASGNDDAAEFLRRCGKPSVDDSTLYDRPRPPIVVRWMVYSKAGVKALFVLDEGGTDSWKSVGFVRIGANQKIDKNEANRLIGCQ